MAKASAGNKIVLNIMKFLIFIMIILALAMTVFLIWHGYLRNNTFTENDSSLSNIIVTDSVKTYAEPDSENADKATEFDVEMNAQWTFRNGKSASEDAYVGNNISNSNSVYFDVTVSGMKEPLYTSPVIPVGSHLENITFEKVLPAGKYNAVMKYYLLGTDGETVTGTIQMALEITVQS